MNELSWIEAWTSWISGNLPENTVIWGISLYWWGRIGKVTQFMAAITVVADIIGTIRLRRFGESLHSRVSLDIMKEIIVSSVVYVVSWLSAVLRPLLYVLKETRNLGSFGMAIWLLRNYRSSVHTLTVSEAEKLSASIGRNYRMTCTWWVLAYGLAIVTIYLYRNNLQWNSAASIFTSILICFIIFAISSTAGLLLAALILVIFAVAGILIDYLIIEPLAWILERPALENNVKIGSLIMLVLGFFFDLLAS